MAEKLINEIQKNLEDAVERYNEGIKEGDLKKVQTARKDADDFAKEYQKRSHADRVAAIAKTEKPMFEVVQHPEYTVKLVKVEKDKNGNETGLKLVDSTKFAGLVEVAKEAGISTAFQYKIDKIAELFAVRSAEKNYEKLDDKKKVEIDRIRRKYRMSAEGRAMDDGPNPTSNTQLLKRLQEVFDEILPEGGKIMTRHLNTMLERFASDDSKSKNGLKLSGTTKVMNHFQKLCYAVVTGTEVELNYKEEKEDASAKAEAPKAEAETVTIPDENAA